MIYVTRFRRFWFAAYSALGHTIGRQPTNASPGDRVAEPHPHRRWCGAIEGDTVAIRVSLLLLLAAVFTALLWQVAVGGPLIAADDWLLAVVTDHAAPALIHAGEVLSTIGGPLTAGLLGLVGLLALSALRRWRALAALLTAMAGAGATVALCKMIVDRPRPDADIGLVAAGSSFPSASAVMASAVFGAYAIIVLPRLFPDRPLHTIRAVLLALPVAVACGRVLVSAHFATDVIAGLSVGAFWVFLANTLLPEHR